MSHFGPRPQNDQQAANSATPQTDRPALWDDEDHYRYLLAIGDISQEEYDYEYLYATQGEEAAEAYRKQVVAEREAGLDVD